MRIPVGQIIRMIILPRSLTFIKDDRVDTYGDYFENLSTVLVGKVTSLRFIR